MCSPSALLVIVTCSRQATSRFISSVSRHAIQPTRSPGRSPPARRWTFATRSKIHTPLTRGSEMNRLYMAVKIAGEDEHHHKSSDLEPQQRIRDAIEAQAMFMSVLKRDDGELTALARAEEALNDLTHGEPH